MALFKIAYQETMQIEGGYANDPDDKGGETFKGISRKNWPHWAGWQIIDSFKNKVGFEANIYASGALQQLVLSFYKTNFWDTMLLDQVTNQDITNEMFDTGVNCGDEVAVGFLQRALNHTNRNQSDYPNLVVDRKMGPKTVATINSHPRPKQVLKLMNCQQGVRYMEICENNEKQEKFMTSWLSRVTL